MRTFFVMLLTAGSCSSLRADFSYQDTTQITGGALFTMMRALGPLGKGAREPIVSTKMIKGNRLATITKERGTIVDLDKESITEMDFSKKTYSVMTFEQMKQALEDAMARAREAKQNKKANDPNVET